MLLLFGSLSSYWLLALSPSSLRCHLMRPGSASCCGVVLVTPKRCFLYRLQFAYAAIVHSCLCVYMHAPARMYVCARAEKGRFFYPPALNPIKGVHAFVVCYRSTNS